MKQTLTGGGLPITAMLSAAREQKQNLGEDAGLTVRRGDSGTALISVFDGCGGAGAMRYAAAENWTGARLASRLCGQALYAWFGSVYTETMTGGAIASGMKEAIDAELLLAKRQLGGGSAIRSSMVRTLPTTLAAALLTDGDGCTRCTPVWAGDSRVYLFDTSGLKQLTTDDVAGELDAQENLERDGVLSNVVSADGAYTLHWREIRLDAPCAVLTATDGCFSYFHSPIEFEALLLNTLFQSDSPAAWEAALTEQIGRVASDDYTLEMAVLGFDSFDALKAAYRPWAETFFARFGEPAARAGKQGDRARLLALWQEYKTGYMQ